MAIETLDLKARDGRVATGIADVTRIGAGRRWLRAGSIALIGTALGAASIVIPGLHFVSTWLLPMLAIGVAAWVVRVRARVGEVELTCPTCGARGRTEPVGTVADDAVWVRCPACAAPLELSIPGAAPPG